MDRQKVDELPALQVQFFETTGIPVFKVCVWSTECVSWLLYCRLASCKSIYGQFFYKLYLANLLKTYYTKFLTKTKINK